MPESPDPLCFCTSADAGECFRLRHRLGILDVYPDDRCECLCHGENAALLPDSSQCG